ncbi:hypothetical protein INT47_001455 [Mucor saturninus]|uniref:Arf-GAP domain-containing protein n=1 Tax=Mucor saturninus TaxID=64648 RepID=A0A8H7R1E8_9FUNG|nr:hypothetical protein INT47_001455 [Mucor saturninus]
MAQMIAKKQEEWNSQKVRELLRLPENKKCFDCPTKSPFFVNVSIQTFLCTRCSGLVREVGHRVKSISASKFSGPEIVALQHGGNEVARTIWLSNYRIDTPEPETDADIRLFMRQKYYEQKWLDRQKGVAHAENVKRIITELYAPDGSRKVNTTVGRSGSIDKRRSLDIRPKIAPTQSWVDDNVPIGLIPAVQHNKNAMDDLLLNDDNMLSPKSPSFSSVPMSIMTPPPSSNQHFRNPPSSNQPILNPPASKPMSPITVSPTNDIFSELAGLATHTPVASPTYSGGILQPNSPKPSTIPSMTPQPQQQQKPTVYKEDPYAALRDLSIGSKPAATPIMNTLKIKTSDDAMSWGDFQKSPTKMSFNKPMFSDLDPLFK